MFKSSKLLVLRTPKWVRKCSITLKLLRTPAKAFFGEDTITTILDLDTKEAKQSGVLCFNVQWWSTSLISKPSTSNRIRKEKLFNQMLLNSKGVNEGIEVEANLIKSSILDSIHDLLKIESAPGGLKSGATPLVPAVNQPRIKWHRVGGVEPPIAPKHTVYLSHPIEVPKPHNQLPNDGIHAWAESAAGDDRGPGCAGVEEDAFAGASPVVSQLEGRCRGGGRKVEDNLAKDDVGGRYVEAGWSVVEAVVVQGVCECLEVGKIVCKMR